MKILSLAFVAGLIIYSQNSFSQESILDSTHFDAIDLNEVIISVNKSEETKRSVAQEIQIISASQIINIQSQNTADLLANSGTVSIQKSQMGGGSPVIRGFEANRILLVIDGVRMNNLIYRGGHLQSILSFDNSILDRIEVLFGPSSTVYGSDALGGVIHLFTKKPAFASEDKKIKILANAFTRYGSVNNEMATHADFNIGGNKIASLTSFSYSDFDHLKGGENQNLFYSTSIGERPYYVERINGTDTLIKNSNRFLQIQSGYSQYDILQKFAFKQNDFIKHSLNFQYSNSSDIPRYDRLTDSSGNGLRFAEWYYGPQKRILGAYDLNISKPDSYFQNIHALINYQTIEESRHSRRFGSNNLQHRIENVKVLGANVDLQKISGNHILRYGLDGQYNSLVSKAYLENIATGLVDKLDTRYPDGDNSLTSVAAYFSHSWHINDGLSLTDGIRLGFVSLHSTFEDSSILHLPYTSVDQDNLVYSGSVGLIYTPSDNLKYSIQLSSGFRVPNIDDLSKVFESSTGVIIVPNSNLESEKTINTEVGMTKIFGNQIKWENSLFYTKLIDAIVTDKFKYKDQDSIYYNGELSSVFANQNKQKAYLFGFSTKVRSQFSEYLFFTLGMNYTYGRIETDSSDYPLDHVSPFLIHTQFTYTKEKFSSDIFINYNGWKKLDDYNLNGEDNEQYATAEGTPAWFTLNFRTSYKIHKLFTFQAGVDNIFDTQYRTFASGINAPGRNVFAAIRFHY